MIKMITEQEKVASLDINRPYDAEELAQINPVDAFISLIDVNGKMVLDLDYSKGLFTWDSFERRKQALAKRKTVDLGIEVSTNSPVVIQELVGFDLPDIGLIYPHDSIDGVWALRALMYLRKYEMGPMLEVFRSLLVPSGLVCMSVYKGEGEVAIQGAWKRGFSDGVVALWGEAEIGKLYEEFGFEEKSKQTISSRGNSPIEQAVLLSLLSVVK